MLGKLATLTIAALGLVATSAHADEGEPPVDTTGQTGVLAQADAAEPTNKDLQTNKPAPAEPEGELASDSFFIVPCAGAEMVSLVSPLRAPGGGAVMMDGRPSLAYAPAFSVNMGVHLSGLTLGARYQASIFHESGYRALEMHKVYGEIGFVARAKDSMLVGYLDAGWTSASTATQFVGGVGGKVGLNFDFMVSREVSFGPGFSFDVQAFRQNDAWVVAYGGTAQLRLGFHVD